MLLPSGAVLGLVFSLVKELKGREVSGSREQQRNLEHSRQGEQFFIGVKDTHSHSRYPEEARTQLLPKGWFVFLVFCSFVFQLLKGLPPLI